jgi:hypothetical protein
MGAQSSKAFQMAQDYAFRIFNRRPRYYERLKEETTTEEYASSEKSSWVSYLLCWTPRRSLLYTATVLTLLVSVGYSLFQKTEKSWHGPHRYQDQMFHLIIPSPQPDSELCKTILTAGILGYPTPIMVNYNETLDKPGRRWDREREKISMLSDYFDRMGTHSDADIAMVFDTSYSWFQLRPEVLLKRYFAVNQQANRGFEKDFGHDEVAFGSIRQDVILSARKGCSGADDDRTYCSSAHTNVSVDDSPGPLNFPSASTIIGPVAKLRSIFSRANKKAEEHVGNTDAHTLYAEIFAEQELRRARLRYRSLSWTSQQWRSLQAQFGLAGHHVDLKLAAEMDQDADNEYGIGLDYNNEISSLVDGEHVDHFMASQEGYPELEIPADIEESMPPWWSPSGNHPFLWSSWKHATVVAHAETKTIPAVVNFPHNTTKSQKDHWKDFWMTQHAAILWAENVAIPRLPVASVVDVNGIEHLFWDASVRFDRAGVRTTEGAWAEWGDICDEDSTFQPAGTVNS